MHSTVFKKGLLNGLYITAELAKAIIPVYILIRLLERSGMMEVIAGWFAPIMSLVGLPGEASLVLVIGNMLTLYPTFGAIQALDLTVKQVTIIALMLLISHSIFMEGAVIRKAGSKAILLTSIRLVVSIFSGIVINLLW